MSDLPPVCHLGGVLGLPSPFVARLSAGLRGKLVLVTGGVGFLGGHIVSVLLQAGARVRVFDVVLPREGNTAWKKDDPVEVVTGQCAERSIRMHLARSLWQHRLTSRAVVLLCLR
jgi:nucleoside-diphosphate-sugar epimerase